MWYLHCIITDVRTSNVTTTRIVEIVNVRLSNVITTRICVIVDVRTSNVITTRIEYLLVFVYRTSSQLVLCYCWRSFIERHHNSYCEITDVRLTNIITTRKVLFMYLGQRYSTYLSRTINWYSTYGQQQLVFCNKSRDIQHFFPKSRVNII